MRWFVYLADALLLLVALGLILLVPRPLGLVTLVSIAGLVVAGALLALLPELLGWANHQAQRNRVEKEGTEAAEVFPPATPPPDRSVTQKAEPPHSPSENLGRDSVKIHLEPDRVASGDQLASGDEKSRAADEIAEALQALCERAEFAASRVEGRLATLESLLRDAEMLGLDRDGATEAEAEQVEALRERVTRLEAALKVMGTSPPSRRSAKETASPAEASETDRISPTPPTRRRKRPDRARHPGGSTAGQPEFSLTSARAPRRGGPSPESAVTRLEIHGPFGMGNRPYVRGEGAELEWNQGIPMDLVEIGRWAWETADLSSPVRIRIFLNDETYLETCGEILVRPGERRFLETPLLRADRGG